MKTRTTLTAGSVICAALGAIIGSVIKDLPDYLSFSDLVDLFFVIFGIFILLSALPDLVGAIARFGTPRGILDLIACLISALVGTVMIFFHERFLVWMIAAYLIVFPILQLLISRSKDERRARLKRLVPKIVLGILFTVFLPLLSGLANTVFDLLLTVIGWVVIALSALFLVIALFLLYLRPLLKKKRKKHSNDIIYLDGEDFNVKKD